MLDQARQLVGHDRHQEYGDPTENMTRTAAMLSAYLGERKGTEIGPHDVAVFGIILKLGRIAENPESLDSWIDVAGYSSIGFEAIGGSVKRKPGRPRKQQA